MVERQASPQITLADLLLNAADNAREDGHRALARQLIDQVYASLVAREQAKRLGVLPCALTKRESTRLAEAMSYLAKLQL